MVVIRAQVPFPEPLALNSEHLIEYPDPAKQSTNQRATGIDFVPGEPTISLKPVEVDGYLHRLLATPLLDEIYDQLWLVARKWSQKVDPLHVQRIKGRSLIPAEDPRFHLVWQHDKVFLKPMPICLLNYDFWNNHLCSPVPDAVWTDPRKPSSSNDTPFDRSVALGFLRSYALLIRHHIDFVYAKDAHLIPEGLDWIRWSKFINHFRTLEDNQVAKRYHYGQLRLNRLNWLVRFYRPRNAETIWFYEVPHWSIGVYLQRVTFPLLFMFASVSLTLSAMQVAHSVPADALWSQSSSASGLLYVGRASWVFAVAVLLLSGVVWLLLGGIPLTAVAYQLQWGFRKHVHERKQQNRV